MQIYKRLEQDHDKQRDLCEQIKHTRGDSEKRNKLWAELRVELEAHASAEEQAFYSELMKDPKGTDDTRHAVEEHQLMTEQIEVLDNLDMDADVWMKKFEKLAHKVIHHVDEEEAEFFPKAKKLFSDKEAEDMCDAFNERKPAEIEKQELAA
ncbi:hemerythrin domain-containing protein [Hellea balneolensis]|uniref:hemerythrin domain-containing protein n=1 Tax=Hellea balneolensis TaxID=287478 RepID=UPI0004274936|nr:hemerythrin domain-containing protein [Hellea balneolensis]